MSTISNGLTIGFYLKYSKSSCEKCGQKTSLMLSKMDANPNRLFYLCEKCGFSHWCTHTNYFVNDDELGDVSSQLRVNEAAFPNSSASIEYHIPFVKLVCANIVASCLLLLVGFIICHLIM
ncbi:hypothetical protein OROMI_027805 [Orobanche minor]